jgi:hypothetical protein
VKGSGNHEVSTGVDAAVIKSTTIEPEIRD